MRTTPSPRNRFSRLPAILIAGGLGLLGFGITPARAITALAARNTAFKLQSEAMRYYKEGSYKKAIELLRQVTNISLTSFLAHFYLGLSLLADRQYSEALEPLKISLELEPGHIQAHIALGDAYLKLGDLAEARAEYLRALNLQDTFAPAHDGLGKIYEAQGDEDKAIASYQKALELNVAYPEGYAHLGELYLRRGQLDEAIALFEKAISVKADFSLGFSRLGIAYSREGMVNQAIASISHAKEISPEDPLPYLSLGEIYLKAGNRLRAESEIEAGIARDPALHEGYLLKARLLVAGEDLQGAIAALQGALDGNLRDTTGRHELEKARDDYRAKGDRIRELTAAIAATPSEPGPYRELASLLYGLGCLDRPVELARRAAELHGDDATGLQLSFYLLSAGQTAEAVPILQDLASRGSAPALLNLGVAQATLGRNREAAESFRKYLADHATDPLAHLYLGNCLLRLGQAKEAGASYQKYLDLARGDEQTGKVRRLLRLVGQPEEAR